MRIAEIITRADDLGGAQSHLLALATELAGAGEEVEVFAGGAGILSDLLVSAGVKFTEINSLGRSINPAADLRALFEIEKKVAAFKPDLIAAHSSKAGLLARIVAYRLGVPAIFTAHGWSFTTGVPFPQSSIYLILEKFAARFGGEVIAVSGHDRKLAIDHRVISETKISVVHNGIADLSDGLQCRADASPPRLVSVARACEQKDYPTLFEALATLKDLEWSLDAYGGGPLEGEMKRLAETLGIGDRVKFLGLRNDVPQQLPNYQIFLLISNWEGFPISTIEAMRAGLPVVISDVGGAGEAVDDSDTGFLIGHKDHKMLAEKIRALIETPSLRSEMGKKGRARFEKDFTFEKMYQETIKLYRRAVAGRQKG